MTQVVNLWTKVLIFVLVAIFARIATANPIQKEGDPLGQSPNFDQQIQLIDAEIWLLKAELAQKNGDREQVKSYLKNLGTSFPKERMPDHFSYRIEKLNYYLNLTSEAASQINFTEYAFNPSRMLALLPMSGEYAEAGLAIYQAMVAELEAVAPSFSLEVLDTNIYDSMHEAWEWVQLYQPSFIFGPLQKEKVLALEQLSIQTPMLVFNEAHFTDPSVKFLTPHSSQGQINKLATLLGNGVYRRVIVLTDGSVRSQNLFHQFQTTWQALHREASHNGSPILVEQQVLSYLDKALEQALHGQNSEIRKGWLQKVVQTPIQSLTRPRQDIDLIVSFLPYRLAMQVTPLLAYYRLNHLSHYWVPSTLPSVEALLRSLPFWQGTTAIFPSYYTESLKAKNKDIDPLKDQVGIFPALGTTAIKTVTRLSFDQPNVIQTELGILSLDASGRLHLLPDLVWMDLGVFEKLED